jgi:hypothetical protein
MYNLNMIMLSTTAAAKNIDHTFNMAKPLARAPKPKLTVTHVSALFSLAREFLPCMHL